MVVSFESSTDGIYFSGCRCRRKMIARGANEREPTLELPPCPDEDAGMGSLKARRVRKRKSLMDLL